jgi:hypothetical protein|tara:strand:- start:130 stop:363 length:234 start_codon:yes stop_codon:yes gene_type:complete
MYLYNNAQEKKMLKLIKLEEKIYTLETLEENVFITKETWSEFWKVQIVDDSGFGEVEYFKTLKSIQKYISINMGVMV